MSNPYAEKANPPPPADPQEQARLDAEREIRKAVKKAKKKIKKAKRKAADKAKRKAKKTTKKYYFTDDSNCLDDVMEFGYDVLIGWWRD